MFRGISTDGEFVYGSYIKDGSHAFIVSNNATAYKRHESCKDIVFLEKDITIIASESIAMKTGEKDENGKEIYGSIEINGKMTKGGDVIFFRTELHKKGITGNVKFKNEGLISYWDFNHDIFNDSPPKDIRIVGNQFPGGTK